jgi:hypothetical protein
MLKPRPQPQSTAYIMLTTCPTVPLMQSPPLVVSVAMLSPPAMFWLSEYAKPYPPHPVGRLQ